MAHIELRFLWLSIAHVWVVKTLLGFLLKLMPLNWVKMLNVLRSSCSDGRIGPFCRNITWCYPSGACMKLLYLFLKYDIVMQTNWVSIFTYCFLYSLSLDSVPSRLQGDSFWWLLLGFHLLHIIRWNFLLFLRIWLKLLCRRHIFRGLFFLIFKILLEVHFRQSFIPSFKIIFWDRVVASLVLLSRRSLVRRHALLGGRVDRFSAWVNWPGRRSVYGLMVCFRIKNFTPHVEGFFTNFWGTNHIGIGVCRS